MHLQKQSKKLLSLIHSSYTSSIGAKLILLLGPLGAGKTEILPYIEPFLVEQGCLLDGELFVVNHEFGLANFLSRLTQNESACPPTLPLNTKILIINEVDVFKNPSAIKQITDLGVSVILVSQADINHLNQAFKFKGDLYTHISSDYLINTVKLIIDYKLLTPRKVGYAYYTSQNASKPILTLDGNIVVLDQDNVITNEVRIRTI